MSKSRKLFASVHLCQLQHTFLSLHLITRQMSVNKQVHLKSLVEILYRILQDFIESYNILKDPVSSHRILLYLGS